MKSKAPVKEEPVRAQKVLDGLIKSYRNYRSLTWVRTGIAAVDLVCGGGLPLGRFVEVIGNPSTCKTVLALSICQSAIRQGGGAAYLDPEAKVEARFASRFVDWPKLVYRVPQTLQETFDRALRAARKLRDLYPKGPVVVALDSIAASALDKEIEELEKNESVKLSGEVGTKARALSIGFPAIMQEFWRNDILFLGINHLKVHMGAYFHSFLESPGGRAIWYHAALRVLLTQREKLYNENKAVEGISISVEAIKNNVSSPYRKASKVPFDFATGFDPWKGALEVLVAAGRVKPHEKAGWFRYDGLKFREKDLAEVVKRKPKLMDAIP